MFELGTVSDDQRAGFQVLVFEPGDLQPGVDHTHVATLDIFNHDVQAIKAGAQWYSLLIDRLQLDRLLKKAVGKVTADGIFECLHYAAGQRAHTTKHVERGRVHTIFIGEGKLIVGHLDGDGNQNRVIGYLHKVGAPAEVHL